MLLFSRITVVSANVFPKEDVDVSVGVGIISASAVAVIGVALGDNASIS